MTVIQISNNNNKQIKSGQAKYFSVKRKIAYMRHMYPNAKLQEGFGYHLNNPIKREENFYIWNICQDTNEN